MTATMIDTQVRWHLHPSCPADWSAHIELCGGGFFHSPAGLAASGEQGEPFFAELREGSRVLGIAAGIQRRCRVPPLPRHAHLPTPPVLAPGDLPMSLAVEALIDAARDAEWADLTIDSFEADGEIPTEAGATQLHARHEYDIVLAGTPSDLLGRLSAHHRRRLREGGDWTLHTLSGGDARTLVLEVTSSAQDRASNRRGVAYDVTLPPIEAFREDPAWGLTTYAAMKGGQALSAALVGWAGKRAYYVSGGSTPDGYAHNASVWLHFQIALAFQSAGFSHYCLGGAPASAADPADSSHGLHRFKTGFGALVRSCAGARWVLGVEHDAGHRFTRWLRDHFTRAKETA
ncbi:MAG TPA: GNAT family N-acetyltransferase [Gemmatimonadales bacterium]|jgi:hypothetical protein|nr:GNAT family N-acetyltransferase [Gemmatimonadales bacterium]